MFVTCVFCFGFLCGLRFVALRSVALGCVVLCFVFCVFCFGFVVAFLGLGVVFLVFGFVV